MGRAGLPVRRAHPHDANDPRRVLAYDIISNDMVASAQRDIVQYADTDNTPSNRESLRLHIQRDLEANYLNRPATSIVVLDPVRTGNHVSRLSSWRRSLA